MNGLFTYSGFLARWLAAMFLVLATYNPSGYSYYHWVATLAADQWPFKLLGGLSLIILYLTFGVATLRSIGVIGIVLATLFFGSITWAIVDIGFVERINGMTMVTIALIVLANVLAVGLSWSYVRQRLSGQTDSNDVTDLTRIF
ncbi:MAG: hypothetical protein HY057_03530 [Rhodospirillales bacterium]|nr:hypothetical protein [Rhodospirillales bacterium]